MDEARVAERYATAKAGYRLLRCEPAALPFFVVTAPALVEQKKPIGPLEEFVLRSIAADLRSIPAIADFLGLAEPLVEGCVTQLWQQDLIEVPATASGRVLQLLPAGARALEDLSLIGAEERDVWFSFDRLRWEPAPVHPGGLLLPRDIRELGLLLIKPRKLARPDVDDLTTALVDRAVGVSMKSALGTLQVLLIKRVDRADQKYMPCHLLVYESVDGRDHSVEVAVDGRVNPEIGSLIDALGGAEKLGMKFAKPAAEDPSERKSVEMMALPEGVEVLALNDVDQIRRSNTGQGEVVPETDSAVRAPALEEVRARNLDTYEHPVFLREAIKKANRRLLITSAWVRDAIVTDDFLEAIRRLARANVSIHIGYGINPGATKCDKRAISELEEVDRKYDSVTVGLLGFTHAKLLIWDDCQITTSFNWLSFQGDEDRTYRQELGILVKGGDSYIDDLYDKQRGLIEKARRGRPPT